MTSKFSVEIKTSSEGGQYALASIEQTFGKHTLVRIESNIPNNFGSSPVLEVQADLYEVVAKDLQELAAELRRQIQKPAE